MLYGRNRTRDLGRNADWSSNCLVEGGSAPLELEPIRDTHFWISVSRAHNNNNNVAILELVLNPPLVTMITYIHLRFKWMASYFKAGPL